VVNGKSIKVEATDDSLIDQVEKEKKVKKG